MTTANLDGRPDLSRVQRMRKRVLAALAVALAATLPITASLTGPESALHETVETTGFGLIVACLLGRTWSSLYIGGRKRETLVTDGPYSLTRNPLYLFSVFGAAGVGLTTGSMTFGLGFALTAFLVFDGVIRSEETWLRTTFDPQFANYSATVPRWWPRISGWRDVHEVTARPRLILTTFRDASLFVLAVPLTESIDHLQEAGYLPVLLRLP